MVFYYALLEACKDSSDPLMQNLEFLSTQDQYLTIQKKITKHYFTPTSNNDVDLRLNLIRKLVEKVAEPKYLLDYRNPTQPLTIHLVGFLDQTSTANTSKDSPSYHAFGPYGNMFIPALNVGASPQKESIAKLKSAKYTWGLRVFDDTAFSNECIKMSRRSINLIAGITDEYQKQWKKDNPASVGIPHSCYQTSGSLDDPNSTHTFKLTSMQMFTDIPTQTKEQTARVNDMLASDSEEEHGGRTSAVGASAVQPLSEPGKCRIKDLGDPKGFFSMLEKRYDLSGVCVSYPEVINQNNQGLAPRHFPDVFTEGQPMLVEVNLRFWEIAGNPNTSNRPPSLTSQLLVKKITLLPNDKLSAGSIVDKLTATTQPNGSPSKRIHSNASEDGRSSKKSKTVGTNNEDHTAGPVEGDANDDGQASDVVDDGDETMT